MSQVKLTKGGASNHIQVTATAMSVPLCAAFLPFEEFPIAGKGGRAGEGAS